MYKLIIMDCNKKIRLDQSVSIFEHAVKMAEKIMDVDDTSMIIDEVNDLGLSTFKNIESFTAITIGKFNGESFVWHHLREEHSWVNEISIENNKDYCTKQTKDGASTREVSASCLQTKNFASIIPNSYKDFLENSKNIKFCPFCGKRIHECFASKEDYEDFLSGD